MFKIIDDYSFFPLTPNLMLSFIQTKSQSTISYQNIDEKFAISFNNKIVENARDWIVSTDRNVLEKLTSRKDFGQNNDTVTFDKIKTMIKGYEY